MSVTVDDLKPKPLQIELTVAGKDEKLKLESKPLRFKHTLMIANVANVLGAEESVAKEKIQQAQDDLDEVIADLIPELQDVELSLNNTMELIEQFMDSVQPTEQRQLEEKGVKIDTDPKVQGTGS